MRDVPAPRPPGAKAPAPAPRSRPKPHGSTNPVSAKTSSPHEAARRPPPPRSRRRRSARCAAPPWTRRTAGSSRARAGTSCARGAGTSSWSRPTPPTKSGGARRAAPSTTALHPVRRAVRGGPRGGKPAARRERARGRDQAEFGRERTRERRVAAGGRARRGGSLEAGALRRGFRELESSSRAKASRDTSSLKDIPARPRLSAADRKRLFDVRVIRRDLVYVVGLTPRLCEEAPLRETGVFQSSARC